MEIKQFTVQGNFTQEQVETVKAFAQAVETGSLEGLQYFCGVSKIWQDKESNYFHPDTILRRKPAPKYRPWTPEEAIGKVVRDSRAPNILETITKAQPLNCRVGDTTWVGYSRLHEVYTQLDGSPCGVLEGGNS